ncbi:MAG: hypothetical protein WC518_00075 [Patescibacteria group bacterium]
MKINSNIFKEYDIRGKYPGELDEQTTQALGLAFAKMIKTKRIIVGRDARPESEKVFWPLLFGLAKGGMQIYDLGVCSTPELFFAVGDKKIESGVMITASHSPAGQTGFKFCNEQGVVYGLKTGLKKLKYLADQEIKKINKPVLQPAKVEKVALAALAKDYQKFAFSFVKPAAIAGFKMVIDASGGSSYRLINRLVQKLPLQTIKINFKEKDKYPDHDLNPLLSENQRVAAREIKKQQADLGVVLDGDGDRIVFLDERGRFVEPYYLNCLLAEIFLKLRPKMTVLFDARLNLAITEVIKNNGGRPLSHRSGYANFIDFMTKKKLLFGCENSGHFLINFALKKKRQYVYGDTLIILLLILKYLKEKNLKLSQAIEPFEKKYVISGEQNFRVKDFKKLMLKIKKEFRGNRLETIDGLSVWSQGGDWFFNIRPSHTEPVVRLNVEAKNKKIINQLVKKIKLII